MDRGDSLAAKNWQLSQPRERNCNNYCEGQFKIIFLLLKLELSSFYNTPGSGNSKVGWTVDTLESYFFRISNSIAVYPRNQNHMPDRRLPDDEWTTLCLIQLKSCFFPSLIFVLNLYHDPHQNPWKKKPSTSEKTLSTPFAQINNKILRKTSTYFRIKKCAKNLTLQGLFFCV